jgi:hypothetical protein
MEKFSIKKAEEFAKWVNSKRIIFKPGTTVLEAKKIFEESLKNSEAKNESQKVISSNGESGAKSAC